MLDEYIALLRDRPVDPDFSLFQPTSEKAFIKTYYDSYGELPPEDVFLHELGVSAPSEVAPWSYYEKRLKEEKFIRDAIPMLTSFNAEYDKGQKDALLHLRDSLVSLVEPSNMIQPVSIVRDLSRYEHFKAVSNSRILTGIKPLDDASGGLSVQDEFAIISARLGIGKSWVAHVMAKSMCESGYTVGLYSGEMSEDEVGARFDSLLSHLSNFALTRGKDVDLAEHLEKLQQVPGDLLVLTANQLRHNARPSDLRKFVRQYNIQCLFIDQLSLMEPDNMRGGEEYERKAMLSYQLKSLQQELRIPIVAVSQLNRAAATQEADASNISGSDRIGQDATLILALARKEDTLKIKVLKARSFRIPEQPWEFTWDIDKGILEPKLSAMDAVRAKVELAKAKQATAEVLAQDNTSTEGEDEIW